MKTILYTTIAVIVFVLGDVYGVDGAATAVTEGLTFIKEAVATNAG